MFLFFFLAGLIRNAFGEHPLVWSLVPSSNCSHNITNGPSDLFHLPTKEGLISQFYQTEELWKIDKIAGLKKKLKLVSYTSDHYRKEPVVICDIFVFPSNIECICELEEEVGRHEKYCPLLLAAFSMNEKEYGLDLRTNTAKTSVIDFKNVTCFAGSVAALQNDPFYKETVKMLSKTHSFPVVIQRKFLVLADFVQNLRPLRAFLSKPGIVVHWRRGDQLRLRCGRTEHSVNCGGPTEFIAQVRNDTKPYAHANYTVFVATNEVNVTILQALHSVGYLTHVNITNALVMSGFQLTMIETFGLELVLMCQSMVFLHYGDSSIDWLVERYKTENKMKKIGV